MIFYFTGTGNSFYVASELAKETGERLVDVGQAVKKGRYDYEIAPNEKVGFVFPVYFGGLPTAVSHFISRVELDGLTPHHYVYGVVTYGGNAMGVDQMLRDKLERSLYHLTIAYTVQMPENYSVMMKLQSEEEQDQILEDAQEEIDWIKDSIATLSTDIGYESSKKEMLVSTVAYRIYQKGRKTKKFWVDEQCVSCHACENRCPANAIELIDGEPTWVKERCVHCLQCARCGAIHYGNAFEKNGRYKHPVFRKKSCC